MFEGISATLFTASYSAALALEISRLYTRSRAVGVALVAFGAAGIVAHTLYLGSRAVQSDASPLSSPYDWYLLAGWVLAVLYLGLAVGRRGAALGLFILPLVLALIGIAQFAGEEPFAPQRASRFWGDVHGAFLLLGTVAVMVGFVAGSMYLVQSYRLKHMRLAGEALRLPSLEWLEKINSRALLGSVLLIGVGFAAGVILNQIKFHQATGSLPWTDPVVVTSGLMLAWQIVAVLFNLVYRPARRGRKVAYLTVASFVFLAVVLAVVLFGGSRHGGGA